MKLDWLTKRADPQAALVAALANYVYALEGRPEPDGETTLTELKDEIMAAAERRRAGEQTY
jgi:hypothetical protein